MVCYSMIGMAVQPACGDTREWDRQYPSFYESPEAGTLHTVEGKGRTTTDHIMLKSNQKGTCDAVEHTMSESCALCGELGARNEAVARQHHMIGFLLRRELSGLTFVWLPLRPTDNSESDVRVHTKWPSSSAPEQSKPVSSS